jgi:hypothetical protein
MSPDPTAPTEGLLTAGDVAAVCLARGWVHRETESVAAWCADAAAVLGPQAADREALASLLSLLFSYDARAVLERPEHHAVLARQGAREVVRVLTLEILADGPVDSDRLKSVVTAIKEKLPYRNREIFFPLRMMLAGRVGEGDLDRVILLLDRSSGVEGLAPVKSARARILEFCAALD